MPRHTQTYPHHTPLGSRTSRSSWLTLLCFGLGLGLGIWLHLGWTPPATAQRWSQMVMQGLQLMQMATLSEPEEIALGRQIDQQITAQMGFSTDPYLVNRITQIGQRLVPVSDRPTLPYTFRVVPDPNINAFATLGGFVYITTAALQAAEGEDQIAAVLAHEIVHITERHALEQLQRSLQARAGAQLLGLESSDLAALAFELGIDRPHSREDEFVADAKGAELLRRAGYAPSAMAQFLAKLNQGNAPPALFSTHPHPADRIARLNALIPPSTAPTPSLLSPSTRTDIQIMPLLPGVGAP